MLWDIPRLFYPAPKTSFPLTIGHVRYINILTWLRGFQVKLLYLVLFSLYLSLFWELRDKRNLKNLQFWPESLGAMLECWYIKRGLFNNESTSFPWSFPWLEGATGKGPGNEVDNEWVTLYRRYSGLHFCSLTDGNHTPELTETCRLALIYSLFTAFVFAHVARERKTERSRSVL